MEVDRTNSCTQTDKEKPRSSQALKNFIALQQQTIIKG